MFHVTRRAEPYDVCVIGSGAGGGIAAKVLTEAGLHIVLLEAGPDVNPDKDFKQHIWPWELPRRGLGYGGDGDDLMAAHGHWSIAGEPYSRFSGTRFAWFRSRIVGGRMNHFGQGAYRFEPDDFEPTPDGTGWPLNYSELVPFYRKVESHIGGFGFENSSMPAPPPRCSELVVRAGCEKLGLSCPVAPASILTRPKNDRPACHYCGQCWRGCRTGAGFNSSLGLIRPALTTGKLTLITNAMVREIIPGINGRIRSVSYIDKVARHERQVRARAVVVAASPCETARLLLNSRSSMFPNGLANSSGVVGRFLRDSVITQACGYFPRLEAMPPHNHDGSGRPHIWIPNARKADETRFHGRFHLLFVGGRYMPLVSEFDEALNGEEGFGPDLKTMLRQRFGAYINFIAGGPMLSNERNRLEVNPSIPDQWGISTPRFEFHWSENEYQMARAMQERIREVIEASGGEYLGRFPETGDTPHNMSVGGSGFHEQGTVRMGSDPSHSALNSFGQAHEVPNLFVVDAAAFPASSDKPPTLTIMALAWRASEYLVEQAKRGEL
ncbi:MAG: GMC oxidoreductase [Bryobacteraceae bacterium]